MFLRENGSRYRDIQTELLLVSLEYEKELQQIYRHHGFNPLKYENAVRQRETNEIKELCHYDYDYYK